MSNISQNGDFRRAIEKKAVTGVEHGLCAANVRISKCSSIDGHLFIFFILRSYFKVNLISENRAIWWWNLLIFFLHCLSVCVSIFLDLVFFFPKMDQLLWHLRWIYNILYLFLHVFFFHLWLLNSSATFLQVNTWTFGAPELKLAVPVAGKPPAPSTQKWSRSFSFLRCFSWGPLQTTLFSD